MPMSPSGFPSRCMLAGRACLVVGSSETKLNARSVRCSTRRVPRSYGAAHRTFRHRAAPGQIGVDRAAISTAYGSPCCRRDPSSAARWTASARRRRIFFCAVDEPSATATRTWRWRAPGTSRSRSARRPKPGPRAPLARAPSRDLLERAGLAAFAEELAALRARTPPAERARCSAPTSRTCASTASSCSPRRSVGA